MVRHSHLNSPFPEDDDAEIEAHESTDELIRCSSCRQMVYEDADRCPYCGQWLVDTKPRGLPRWAIITGWIILACWLLPLIYLFIWTMLQPR